MPPSNRAAVAVVRPVSRPAVAGYDPAMASPLSTYLNDHLAGSAGALDLLEALHGHAHTPELAATLKSVAAEIEEDRETLLAIFERLGVDTSSTKQAFARVADKALRAKASTVVTRDDGLSRLLGLEALCVGIAGKDAGWTALRAAGHDALGAVDFDELIARAGRQRARLEPFRLEAASQALTNTG